MQKRIFLTRTSPMPFVVPNDFGSLVSIECIGSGGLSEVGSGTGGAGGGAYSAITALAGVAVGSTYSFNVNWQTDTWFDTTGTVLAKSGSDTSSDTGSPGGQSASCVGSTKHSGGSGGNGFPGVLGVLAGGGGGGAAGPNGAGGNGTNASSAVGGNGGAADSGSGGAGGTGGTAASPTGINGSNGTEYDISHGSGGGGGGGAQGSYGGIGGGYGGGAGSAQNYSHGLYGALGLIIFTYNSPITPITCRSCKRLAEPQNTTLEQISLTSLQVTVTLPISIVNQYVAQIPNTGPDTLIVNYTDSLGQAQQFTRNVTLWASDYGYIFLSADQSTQLLIASVNPTFWQTYAASTNSRNVAASASPLLPCCNASRYGANVLLPGQAIPTEFIYNGILLDSGSSSSSG